MVPQWNEGDKVRLIENAIDAPVGDGETGVITGFARLSAYHPREAMVRLESGKSGWFWLRALEAA